MKKEPPPQTTSTGSSDLDAIADKKRFTYRELWIIITTVLGAAITLGVFISNIYASFRESMAEINATVHNVKEVQDERNKYLTEQIKDLKANINKLQDAVFKPK